MSIYNWFKTYQKELKSMPSIGSAFML